MRFRIAPVAVIPVPEIVNGSAIDNPAPLMCTAAPDATDVAPTAVPNAESLLTATTPESTEVAPVNVFVADRVSVPDPDLVSAPEPEITPVCNV